MLMKNITSLLVCMVMLLATMPSKAFAQITAQKVAQDSGQSSGDTQAKPDLRSAFAEVTAKAKSGVLMEADIKRLERDRLNVQPQPGNSKRDKIIVYAIVAGLVVLGVVLAIKLGKGGRSICEDVPTDPGC